MAKSAGVSRDIDLTERGDFRDGVEDILTFCTYTPGILPWDSDGTIKNNKRERVHYWRQTGDGLFHSIDIWNNADLVDFITTDDDGDGIWWTMTAKYNVSSSRTVHVKSRQQVTIHSVDDLIPYMDRHILYIENGSVYAKTKQDLFYHKPKFTQSQSSKAYTWSELSNNTSIIHIENNALCDNSGVTFMLCTDNDIIELVLEGLESVKLTPKEIDDRVFLCGRADEVSKKILKKKYLKEAQAIIDLYQPKERKHNTCKNCGREFPIGIFGTTESIVLCAKCALHDFMNMHPKSDSAISSIKNRSLGDEEMRGDGFKSFALHDDQSLTDSDTIDYYHQTRYADRGVFLLRAPRGSFELETELSDNLTLENPDDEDEVPRWSREPERVFKSDDGYGLYYRTQLTSSINNMLNRA